MGTIKDFLTITVHATARWRKFNDLMAEINGETVLMILFIYHIEILSTKSMPCRLLVIFFPPVFSGKPHFNEPLIDKPEIFDSLLFAIFNDFLFSWEIKLAG